MKLDAQKFGLATGIVFAVVWLICSAFVVTMPGMMMQMSGHAMHADFSGAQWTMTGVGFVFGLVIWSVLGGLLAWAVAAVYNRLLR